MAETLQAWLRRRVGWSNSRQSWEERLAAVLLVGGAGLLLWMHDAFSSGMLIALWAGLILMGAMLLRRGWLKLFGPVLFYDLVRTSRRRTHGLMRWGYVMILAVLIGWVYAAWTTQIQYRQATRNDLIDLNSHLFYMFMALQFVMILLITPAYTAGTIADEKNKRTLEFLLASDLRSREIVLGKLLSRMFTILMILLAGLPVLSILQLLGGVGPDLVFWTFAASALTILGLGGLSIACSALTRRGRDAVLLMYLIMFVYGTVSLVLYVFALMPLPLVASVLSQGIDWKLPWPHGWRIAVSLRDLSDWFSAGNPIVATLELFVTGNVTAALPTVMPRYLIFHAALALVLPAWASWRLRPIVLKETYGATGRLPLLWRLFQRPAIGRWPMLWKELFVERGMKFGLIVKIILGGILAVLVLGSFAPAGFMIGYRIYGEIEHKRILRLRTEYEDLRQKQVKLSQEGQTLDQADLDRFSEVQFELQKAQHSYYPGRRDFSEAVNIWARIVGTAVAMLMLLLVAVRAAGSISGERDRQTLNELLTSPLSAEAILFSKWLGAVCSVRWCWVWLGAIWLMALLMGGLYFWSIPYLVFAWLIYAFTAAGIGMWFSVHSKTSLRSINWTVLVLLFVCGGHWLISGLFCYFPLAMARVSARDGTTFEFLMRLEAGQSPPFVLGWLGMCAGDFQHVYRWDDQMKFLAANLFGLASWTVGTTVMAVGLLYRFRRRTQRGGLVLPDRRLVRSTGHRAPSPYKEERVQIVKDGGS